MEEIIKIEIKHTGFPPDLDSAKINDLIRDFVLKLKGLNVEVITYPFIKCEMVGEKHGENWI